MTSYLPFERTVTMESDLTSFFGNSAAVAKFQAAYDIAREANEKPGEVASRDMLITLYSPDTKPQIGTAASIEGGASNFK